MKLKEFLCKLFCKLPRWLRNALCWVYRGFIMDIWKFYSSADTWKDFWGFIKNIMGDFNYALKMWVKKVFKGINPPPIPLKKGILPLPGDNSYARMSLRIAIVCMIAGIFAGLFLMSLVSLAIKYLGVILPIILFCLFILPLIFLLLILIYQVDTYRLGYLGERTVAEELEKYGRNRNWRIFHNFFIPKSEDKSDIDHIVVCPNGVFCVETKAWRWLKGKKINIGNEKISIEKNNKIYDNINLDDWKPVIQARKNVTRLQDFLNRQIPQLAGKDKRSFEIQFVSVVFFVNTYVYGYPTSKLIIGNSEKVGWNFDKHENILFAEHGKERNLTSEQIDKISQILEQASRSDIKEEKELLEK